MNMREFVESLRMFSALSVMAPGKRGAVSSLSTENGMDTQQLIDNAVAAERKRIATRLADIVVSHPASAHGAAVCELLVEMERGMLTDAGMSPESADALCRMNYDRGIAIGKLRRLAEECQRAIKALRDAAESAP